MPVPAGYTVDKPSSVQLPAGYTLDGAQSSRPAFAANPRNEGTYKMIGPSGSSVNVPFSQVRGAQNQQYQVVGDDASRYQKDAAAVPAQPGNTFTSPTPMATLSADLRQGGRQLLDYGKGAVKGALATGSKIVQAVNSPIIPFSDGPTPGNLIPQVAALSNKMQAASGPNTTSQAIGKGLEQASEFLIPGPAEEQGIAKATELLPKAAPYITPLIRGAGSGAVNAIQGGSFLGGALAGGAGSIVGQGLKAAAPVIAETAMGVRAGDRAFGRTPGQTILSETTGTSPASIASQAGTKITGYTGELNNAALNSPSSFDLQPARDVASSFQNTARLQNNAKTLAHVDELNQQLALRQGIPIPQFISAHEGLALKRGVASLAENWNPAATSSLSDAAVKGTIASMQPELTAAIPGYEGLNAKLSTLMPVAQRATAADLNAGVMQRVIGKMARPTGALLGTVAGGTAGYKEGGVPGAIAGGVVGAFAPEMLSSPQFLMGAARLGDSPLTSTAFNGAVGTAEQLPPNPFRKLASLPKQAVAQPNPLYQSQ